MPLGTGLEGPLPWKPKVYEAPGASVGCQLGGVIVQFDPLVAKVALQPLVRATPPGTVQWIVQPLSVVVPVLVTVTLAVKPPDHELCTA